MAGKLTALRVQRLNTPGRYGDGGGLWLQVRDSDRKSWLFRFTFGGKAREMGLGPAADVTLAEARDKARDARRLIQAGTDPIESRRQPKPASGLSGTTFRAVADRYLAAHHDTWRSEKHRWQWGQTLNLAHAVFGDRPVSTIETGDVMAVLEPIWRQKPETASRLRGRIEAVLDYGKARGWREGENPARWRGHLANLLPARSLAHATQSKDVVDLATTPTLTRAARDFIDSLRKVCVAYHHDDEDRGRNRMIFALMATVNFIQDASLRLPANERLELNQIKEPFLTLASAMKDLENGTVHPVLRAALVQNRAPQSSAIRMRRGFAAAALVPAAALSIAAFGTRPRAR